MNIVKGLEPEINFSREVSIEDRLSWRRVIYIAFFSLPTSHQKVVPPFYIHNTMVECLYKTLDYTHPMIDKIMDSFSAGNVWSFAFIQGGGLKNKEIEGDWKRILIANTRTGLTPDLSSEMVVLHEIGHFVDVIINGRKYDEHSQDTVENYCNMYAVRQFIRTMCMFPFYKSYSNDCEIRELQQSISNFILSKRSELGIFDRGFTRKEEESFSKEYTEMIYG